jgi:VWFA-related protein
MRGNAQREIRTWRRGWACVCGVAAAGALTFAQDRQQPPSFRTGVQLIRIDVSVLDGKRQPVRGLQASDFTVLEDGTPRPIRAFQAVDRAAAAAPVTAPLPSHNVATNRTGDDTSRLILILMDRSIPTDRPMIVARQIADAAVDAMAPGDLAAIVTTGGGVPQNLTSDRARLHKTIATSDWSQTPSRAQQDQGAGEYDPLSDGRCLCGLCVMDTITRIANELRDVPRRKVLLFVGSNLIVQAGPRPMNADVGCDKRVRDSRERLFDALGTSGLTVHSIDPQGLATVGPATRASVPNGVANRDGAVLNGQLTRERQEFMAAQGNLDVLPALTGGRTILNSNEPQRMVPAVLHESDTYYLLAFEPIEATRDVRHAIEVKVARKGVDVHTARYMSTSTAAAASGAAAPASPLDRALTDLLPSATLPLGMAVATFAGSDRDHAYVGVTLDASAFAAAPGSIPLEIALSASDERGRRVGGARQNGTVQVPPGAGGGAAAFVELQTFVTLPPGDYELRGAVMNADTGVASSVFTHITVPSFDAARLALSDVVLGTRENAGSLPEGAPAMPIVPTTARMFSASAPAWAFLRVYRGADKDATQPVNIETSVLDSGGKRVKHQSEALRDAAFAGRNADVRLGLPLENLAPGRYVLRIDAKQGRSDASRAIAFEVVRAEPAITPEERTPETDAALAAAAGYIDMYEHRISAIGAEEAYEQAVTSSGNNIVVTGSPLSRPAAANSAAAVTRKTRANIMTISAGARGWVSFRDVFELDGKPVRDREERLSRILQNVTPDSLEQARKIAAESARYNLDSEALRVDRTTNVPMTALLFLRAANQSRSTFRLGKPERIAGIICVTLQFTERSRPRLIRTGDDAPAQGTFWIDMAGGGRVLKTELRMESAGVAGQTVRSQTAVTYARVDKLDLWVPVVMDETYQLPTTRQVVTGRATYSDFREFKVSTAETIK